MGERFVFSKEPQRRIGPLLRHCCASKSAAMFVGERSDGGKYPRAEVRSGEWDRGVASASIQAAVITNIASLDRYESFSATTSLPSKIARCGLGGGNPERTAASRRAGPVQSRPKRPTDLTPLKIRDLGVITSVAILVKVMEKHGLKPSLVESLKELILEPVAVYKSATERESIVVVTAEMPDGINPLLIPIKIDVMGASGKSNFHWMASAYAKEKPEIIERWEKNGLLLSKPAQAAIAALEATPIHSTHEALSIDEVVVLDT